MAGSVRMTRRAERGGFRKSSIIALVVIVVIALIGYGYASPYVALDRLKRAADARDAATVNQYVDFPALRESLKQQVTALLARRLDVKNSGNLLAALGAMIGVALIGPLVDSYATPDGVAALLNGIPPRGEPGERPPPPPSTPQPADAAPPQPPAAKDVPSPPQPPQNHGGLSQPERIRRHVSARCRRHALLRDPASGRSVFVEAGGRRSERSLASVSASSRLKPPRAAPPPTSTPRECCTTRGRAVAYSPRPSTIATGPCDSDARRRPDRLAVR